MSNLLQERKSLISNSNSNSNKRARMELSEGGFESNDRFSHQSFLSPGKIPPSGNKLQDPGSPFY